MTPTGLLTGAALLAIAAVAIALVGYACALVLMVILGRPFSLQSSGVTGRVVMSLFLLSGGALGVAILVTIAAGGWWTVERFFSPFTPWRLVVICVSLGLAPMAVALLGSGLARASGGRVSDAGAEDCSLFGLDLNGIVYHLWMWHWFGVMTLGLVPLGLLAAGIWALIGSFG